MSGFETPKICILPENDSSVAQTCPVAIDYERLFAEQEEKIALQEAENQQLRRDNEGLAISLLCNESIPYVLNKTGMRFAFAEIQKDMSEDDAVMLLFIDLNNFKKINDTAGHIGADAIIAEYANFLLGQVRVQGDAVSRYGGGDEFVVMANLDGADDYNDFLRRVSRPVVITYQAQPDVYKRVKVHSSVGATVVTKQSKYEQVLCAADDAATYAKRTGLEGVALSNSNGDISVIDITPPTRRGLDR